MEPSPVPFIRWSAGLTSAGTLISSLELISLRREFGATGLFAGKSAILFKPPRLRKLLGNVDVMFSGQVFLGLLSARAVASLVCLVLSIVGEISLTAVAALLLTDLLCRFRSPDLRDGAENMFTISLTALVLARLFGSLGLLFLAGQVSLAYLSSGVAKLSQSGWRRGLFLPEILSTRTFGFPPVANWLTAHPPYARFASVLVIGFELLWAFSPYLPPQLSNPFLGCALIFHCGTAILMGLNRFFFAFASAIVAAMYASRWLYSG